MSPRAARLQWFGRGGQLVLTDPDMLYHIVSGNLTVYIAQYADGAPQRRLPGYRFTVGQTIFGLRPESVCLLAVFDDDTEIEELAVGNAGAETRDLPGVWAGLILHAQQDASLFLKKNLSFPDLPTVSYGLGTVASGRFFRFDTGTDPYAFCQVMEGTVKDASSGMTFGRDEGWFPVTENTVLGAETNARIIVDAPEKVTGTIPYARLHATCREWMVRRVTALWDDVLADEERRIRNWTHQENGVLDQIARKGDKKGEGMQALPAVFGTILDNLGMEKKPVSLPDGAKEPRNETDLFRALTGMAEECGVRVRRISLEDSWWNEDCGPLLVFEMGGAPLAALPEKPGQYSLYTGLGIRAGPHEIRGVELLQTGYMVYPALPDTPVTPRDVLLFLYRSIWKRDIASVFLFACFVGVLATAVPVATGLIFNEAIPFQNYSILYAILLVLFMSTLASCIFTIAQDIVIMRLEGRMGSVFEAAVWNRLLRLPPSFFREYNAGNLASRMGVAGSIRSVLSGVTISVIFAAVFSLFNIVLMFGIYPEIAIWAVVLVTGVFFITLIIGYFSVRIRERFIAQQGRLSGITFQMLSGIARIAAAGARNRAFIWWERELQDQAALRLKINTYDAYSRVFTVLWPQLLTILIFALAGHSFSTAFPEGGLGLFLAFYAAAGAFSAAIVGLGGSFIMIWNIKPLWDWLSPVLTAEPEDLSGQLDPGRLSGAVEVNHVKFRYSPDGPPVLDDLSITINTGEFVAVVGPSGSGKSTLLRILLGFEKPDTGSVLYDKKNLSSLNVRQVRKQTGVVLQDGQLMAGSIMDNIAGSRALSPDQVWKAAEIAGIDAEIREMPLEMHTFISEGSGNISGGQKQRILIARAIASRPAILLFDEATSALDNTTQATVMQSLEQLKLTRVVIAHRLSTVTRADRIYVIENGRITDTGTYEELMQREGWFRRYAKLQLA